MLTILQCLPITIKAINAAIRIFTHFLSDCYSEFQPLLRILDYLKANESVKIIVLEGVVNDFRLGVTTGQAAKAAKDFNKMLTTGQIS